MEDRSRPRDEQARILSSGQCSSRFWVNYVSINIPYCVTKYSVGIHRAPEPHELFNRRYIPPPFPSSPSSQHREDGRTPGLPRIPRESRDFWHQFLPVISPVPPPSLYIYLSIFRRLCLSADKCSPADDKSRLAARRYRGEGEEAKIPRGNVDCAVQRHVYLRYARNAHLCTRTHVHVGTGNDASLA